MNFMPPLFRSPFNMQRRLLRPRYVLLTIAVAELLVVAGLLCDLPYGTTMTAAAVLCGGWMFWPTMIGTAWFSGSTAARSLRAAIHSCSRWKTNRFRFGLRTAFVLISVIALLAWLSKVGYDAAHPKIHLMGRVIYQETGAPASHVLVRARTNNNASGVVAFAEAWTDRNGMYRFPTLPPATYNIWAEKEGWTCIAVDSMDPAPNKWVRAPDLPLIEPGWITGRVLNAETGVPVKPAPSEFPGVPYNVLPEVDPHLGAMVYLYGPSRPDSGPVAETYPIELDGTFRVPAAPGKNLVFVFTGQRHDFDLPSAASVTVQQGETSEIELRMIPGIPIGIP